MRLHRFASFVRRTAIVFWMDLANHWELKPGG